MRKGELLFNVIALYGPIIIGVSIGVSLCLVYTWPLISHSLLVTSLFSCGVLLVYSKLPSLKKGNLFTFGISSIEGGRRKYYIFAYIFLFVGLFLSIAMKIVWAT